MKLSLNGFGVVERDGIVKAMLVVTRGDGQERYSRERGKESAVATKQSCTVGLVFRGVCSRQSLFSELRYVDCAQ